MLDWNTHCTGKSVMRIWKSAILGTISFSLLSTSAWAQIPVGAFQVVNITCGGEPANQPVRDTYLPPNAVTIIFDENGPTGAFRDIVSAGSCTKLIPLRYEFPAEGKMVAAFNGPIACTPEACDPACGLDLPITVNYDYRLKGNTLTMTSEPGSADQACTSHGQNDPIVYRLRRLPD